ncbi:UbiD family decarboxylase [Pantoea sp. Aalb]|uniref:UbiD family decarboxylase n=1 Tax=Pantoea sp. Aalb TaxID=2576762 RepID=UPI00132452FE|nr:UbiD family decarboxylase [Pantoea sp. Aalb]MXP68000.1 UbiD family decarboxylase [Pantoea sp. Aalb]
MQNNKQNILINKDEIHPLGWAIPPIDDLRSAIAYLKKYSNEYISTDLPVNIHAQLAGIYKIIGAGGTVIRPTQIGPAMMFNKIEGYPTSRILVGMLASRRRVSLLLGASEQELGKQLASAKRYFIPPIITSHKKAPCQEIVYKANNVDFDLRKILPAPTNTREDAGPFFCMGLILGSDPIDKNKSDVTIHRLCVQGKDELSIFFAPNRHIDDFRKRAEALGRSLPISINMGLDPAIYISASFEAPTTPFGFNELSIAGGLRAKPIELTKCISINEYCISKSEVVIEGEILPYIRIAEDQHTHTGKAMPEFSGYHGNANTSLPVIKVKAITTRKNPILQTLVGPGEEHVNLAGLPTEASIYIAIEEALPGLLQNVYAHSAGGGKLLAILQVKKLSLSDDCNVKQAAINAFAIYRELKNIIIVDEDVDIFDTNDVMWAMQTRYQSNIDTIFLPNITGHILDPSQSPDYNPYLSIKGSTCKTIFDCTVPWKMKNKFIRAQFDDVDPKLWAPSLYNK